MPSLNRSKTISTCPGMPLFPPQHALIPCQWERACSVALGWSTPRLGSPWASGMAPAELWSLGNREPQLIPQQLPTGCLLTASQQRTSSPQSSSKKRWLVATPGYTLNLATSSCCFETQALRVQIIMGRISCKEEEVLRCQEEEDPAQGNQEELWQVLPHRWGKKWCWAEQVRLLLHQKQLRSVSPEQANLGVCAQHSLLLSTIPIFTTAFQHHTPCWSLAFGGCHISLQALGEDYTSAGAGCTGQT